LIIAFDILFIRRLSFFFHDDDILLRFHAIDFLHYRDAEVMG